MFTGKPLIDDRFSNYDGGVDRNRGRYAHIMLLGDRNVLRVGREIADEIREATFRGATSFHVYEMN